MASQILSGLDGVDRKLDPGPSADTPYETKAALLPKSLREAVFALSDDPFFRQALGAEFVDYYVHIKNAEIERFQANVELETSRIFRDVLRSVHNGIGDKDRSARCWQDWPRQLSRSIPIRRQVHRKFATFHPVSIWLFKDRIGPILPLQPMRCLGCAHDVSRDLRIQMRGNRDTCGTGNG